MLQYQVDGQTFYEPWKTFTSKVSSSSNVTYVINPDQAIKVDDTIIQVPTGVTLDFNNCTLDCSTTVISKNNGTVKNAKVSFFDYTIDNEDASAALFCCINEGKLEEIHLKIDTFNIKQANSSVGCIVGYNVSSIGKCSVTLLNMVNVMNSERSNFGLICGTNSNGNITDCKSEGGNISVNSIEIANIGGLCGYSTNGVLHQNSVKLKSLMCMRIKNGNIAAGVGSCHATKITKLTCESIYTLSTINMTGICHVGCLVGHLNTKSSLEFSQMKAISNIYSVSCEKVITGGLVGLMEFDSYCMQSDIKSISLYHSEQCKSNHFGGAVGYNKGYIETIEVGVMFKIKSSNIDTENHIGGVVGTNYGMIKNSVVNKILDINTSKINGDNNVGGLCGHNSVHINASKVKHIEDGQIEGYKINNAGGLVGLNEGNINDCVIDRACDMICYEGLENNSGNICGHTHTDTSSCKAKTSKTPIDNGRFMNKENVVIDTLEMKDEDTDELNTLTKMYYENVEFNEPINHLNTSNVTKSQFAFSGAKKFNQPIDDWDTKRINNMTGMFKGSGFNKDVSKLDFTGTSMDGMENLFNGSYMSRDNMGSFFGNLYSTPKMYKLGTLPNIPKPHSYELYCLSVLTNMFGTQYSPSVDMNTNWLNENLSNVHVGLTEEETEENGMIVSLSKEEIDGQFKGNKLGVATKNLKVKGQVKAVLKLWSSYCYRFKLKGAMNFEGYDLYFRYTPSTGRFMFDSHGNFESQARNMPVYADKEMTKPMKHLSQGTYFYIPVCLSNANDHCISIMPFDYKYRNISSDKVGVLSCPWVQFPNTEHYDTVNILQWGKNAFHSMSNTFDGLKNVITSPKAGVPNLKYCRTLKECFKNCVYTNTDVKLWNTSRVEDISGMFYGCENFNVDIGNWNTSKIKDMNSFLKGAKVFNQDISMWDVSKVTNIKEAFTGTDTFIKKHLLKWPQLYTREVKEYPINELSMLCDLSDFVGSVVNGEDSEEYNKPTDFVNIPYWDNIKFIPSSSENNRIVVKKWGNYPFTDMSGMFENCKVAFSDVLAMPNITICDNMSDMFKNASIENQQHISRWDVSYCRDFSGMFEGSDLYDTDLHWNTQNAVTMKAMFKDTKRFDTNLQWNVSSVCDMSSMFEGAKSFNQNIGRWNTVSLKNMDRMFKDAILFNGDIRDWNTKQVKSMNETFYRAKSFNRNIGLWDITKVRNMNLMFKGARLNTENYDNTLNGWAAQELEYKPNFDGGESRFTESAKEGVEKLRDHGWVIAGVYEVPAAKMVGDPYITPIKGNTYKIPDEDKCYRLYQSNDICVNGVVEKFNNIEELNKHVNRINKQRFDNQLDSNLLHFDDMYFITKIIIFYQGQASVYNIEEERWETEKNSEIIEEETDDVVETLNEFYKNEKISVRTLHIYGTKFEMRVYKCENPQVHTGVELIKVENKCDGILVKECISSSAIVKNLFDFRSLLMRDATEHDGEWITERFFTTDGNSFEKRIRVL